WEFAPGGALGAATFGHARFSAVMCAVGLKVARLTGIVTCLPLCMPSMVASVSESRFPRSRHRRFGRRRIAPHVCIVDSKPHVRRFLAEAFRELGFVTHLCADWAAVSALNDTIPADLVALGVPFDGVDVEATLRKLAHAEFDGMVMLIGGRDAAALESAQRMGEKLQLTMVPALGTPFRAEELADRVASLLP